MGGLDAPAIVTMNKRARRSKLHWTTGARTVRLEAVRTGSDRPTLRPRARLGQPLDAPGAGTLAGEGLTSMLEPAKDLTRQLHRVGQQVGSPVAFDFAPGSPDGCRPPGDLLGRRPIGRFHPSHRFH